MAMSKSKLEKSISCTRGLCEWRGDPWAAVLRGGDLEAPLDRAERVGGEEARPALLPGAGGRVPGAGQVREGEELDAEVARQVDDVPAPRTRPRRGQARAGLGLGPRPRAGRAEQPRHQHTAHLQ